MRGRPAALSIVRSSPVGVVRRVPVGYHDVSYVAKEGPSERACSVTAEEAHCQCHPLCAIQRLPLEHGDARVLRRKVISEFPSGCGSTAAPASGVETSESAAEGDHLSIPQ